MTKKQSLGKTKKFLPNQALQLLTQLTLLLRNPQHVIEVFESKRLHNEV